MEMRGTGVAVIALVTLTLVACGGTETAGQRSRAQEETNCVIYKDQQRSCSVVFTRSVDYRKPPDWASGSGQIVVQTKHSPAGR